MAETVGKVRPATPEDYIKRQGGIPEIREKDGLTIITHNYPQGKGMVVTSHIDHGTVVFDGVEYRVDLLKQFHGDPCEKSSRLVGGRRGYPRK